MQVPSFTLPGAATTPSLDFSPTDIPVLQARRTDPTYSANYNAVKSLVDGSLSASFAGLGDDTLAMVAKGAALLEQLGETPASGPYPRYRDAAVAAIAALQDRTPQDLLGDTGNLDPQEDSGRLQSISEAYDMLRGTGVAPADDTTIRAKIDNWASAFLDDEMVPFQGNNLQVKSGAAMITAALALADDDNASDWLTRGLLYVNNGCKQMGSTTGWWRESPHYLSYSMNNLASTMWQVKNSAGVDWFTPLRPFPRFAIDTRQPGGENSPFEEGVSTVFPYHVLAAGYRGDPIANEMMWAWAQSDQDTDSYSNQQLAQATAFIFYDSTIAQLPPAGSPTRFAGSDTDVSVLRASWARDSVQATLIAAIDYGTTEIINSRHNTRNPLDLVIGGASENLLVTSGGGPQVTLSSDRSYYLTPASKNLVLVGGTAPFVTSSTATATLADRIDSHDSTGAPGLADLSRTTVAPYGSADSVARTLVMVGGAYILVADEVDASSSNALSIGWHGRGALTIVSPSAVTWAYQTASLDSTLVADVPTTVTTVDGHYAETFGHEETIEGIAVTANARNAHFLTYFGPRPTTQTARLVTDESAGGSAALDVVGPDGHDRIAASPTTPVDGVTATAVLALVRDVQGTITGLVGVEATTIAADGHALLASTTPVTLVLTLAAGAVNAQISQDQPAAAYTLTLDDLPGIDLGQAHGATWNGVVLDSGQFQQGTRGFTVNGLSGGGALMISTQITTPTPDAGVPDAAMVVVDAALPDAHVTIPPDAHPADAHAAPDAAISPDAHAALADAAVTPDAPHIGDAHAATPDASATPDAHAPLADAAITPAPDAPLAGDAHATASVDATPLTSPDAAVTMPAASSSGCTIATNQSSPAPFPLLLLAGLVVVVTRGRLRRRALTSRAR